MVYSKKARTTEKLDYRVNSIFRIMQSVRFYNGK